MPKRITKTEAKQWLKESGHDKKYDIIEWPAKAKNKVLFFNKNYNVFFEKTFANFVAKLKKRPNTDFGISKKEQIKKTKQTNLKKYGVESTMSLKKYRDKAQKTIIERYGTKNAFQSKEIKEKIKKTNLKKYGVENPSQSEEIKKKKLQTSLKNYGVEHPLQNKKVAEKRKHTNLKRYGVEIPTQNKDVYEKIKKTRIKKGLTFSIDGMTIADWAKNNSLCSYTTMLNASRLGIHPLETSSGITSIQKHVLNEIKNLGLIENVDFYHNKKFIKHKNKKDGYIIPDFQIPEEKLIIEVNGDYWHCNPKMYEPDYFHPHKNKFAYEIWAEDEEKLKEYEENGYEVIILWEHDIIRSSI